MYEHLNEL